jgi:hypothetical protein
MQKIVFENTDKTTGVIHPTQEALSIATIEQIAEKDVPFQLPYWIVEDSIIPTDRTFRNAWEIDESFGEPDGFGGENNEFDTELLRKYYEVRDADKN